jgi:hypothetical protein
MAGIQVFDVHEDGFQLRACVFLGLEKPHPHVMGMVVDDEQAIAEAMWGGNINGTPEVRGECCK